MTDRARLRTYVYVDGFNLFYGAVRRTPYKWLDLGRLCELLLPRHEVLRIKYFTALVSARPSDPGKPTRQQTYLRALRTIPHAEVCLGHFLTNTVRLPIARPMPGGPTTIEVIKTEEKGSDVNLASHLVHDAHRCLFDAAVMITNDSDLVEPMRLVRTDLHLPVGVLNPHRKPVVELMKNATFTKPIRTGVLAASQFPHTLEDRHGRFSKPTSW